MATLEDLKKPRKQTFDWHEVISHDNRKDSTNQVAEIVSKQVEHKAEVDNAIIMTAHDISEVKNDIKSILQNQAEEIALLNGWLKNQEAQLRTIRDALGLK